MGCDIHVHTEVKIDNTWHHYNNPNVSRNYLLFTHMGLTTRVHSDFIDQPITKTSVPMPYDASLITRLDWQKWDGDAHSLGVFYHKEIMELEDRWKEIKESVDWKPERYTFIESQFGYFFSNGWGDKWRYPDVEYTLQQYAEIQDVRWIFWFDN